jgi:pimeloyl-ACP methyl ester carboxylesterase
MDRLGYDRWVAQGGDWGAAITTAIGVVAPAGCAAIHVNMPLVYPAAEDMADPTPREQDALAAMAYYQNTDSGYAKQQQTRPQSIGYGLVDSPAAQAAWIYEKLWAWTDNQGAPEDALTMDEMLDNIMLYWLPATGASSARIYWESMGSFGKLAGDQLDIPVGASIYPREIFRPTRQWAERRWTNIVHWNELDRGGHFAAWEQPDLFVGEIRDCFRSIRA